MVGALIELISVTNSLHNYTVQQLYKQLTGDLEAKQPMIQVAMWSIGEYADLLNDVSVTSDNEANHTVEISEDEVINKCEEILSTNLMTIVTKEYTIGALTKLSVRFPNSASRIKSLIDAFGCDHSVELQQRAVEFSSLFSKHNYLRPSVLERMPPMTVRADKRNGVANGVAGDEDGNDIAEEPIKREISKPSPSESNSLFDLLDVSPSPVNTNEKFNSLSESTANDILDLLGGLDLKPNANSEPTTNSTSQQSFNNLFNNTINESQTNILFNDFLNEEAPKIANNLIPPIIAFDKNGLKLEFSFERPLDNTNLLIISLSATNSGSQPIDEFIFQAAVPKVCLNSIDSQLTDFVCRHSSYNLSRHRVIKSERIIRELLIRR